MNVNEKSEGDGNMLYRIACCDDEQQILDRLKECFVRLEVQTDIETQVDYYTDGRNLIQAYQADHSKYDIILLDMEMPLISGMQVAEQMRRINREVIIIFLTSYPEYMQKSFGVQAFQYLLKPITYDVFKKEIIRTIQYIEKDNASILVTDGDIGYETAVRLKNIVAIEKKKGNAVMEITLEKSKMNAKGNISDYEDKLVQNHFIRISRNCIVNMKFIHSFFEREIRMTTGKRVEMSRRKITEVKEVFTKYLVLGGNHK